VQLNIARRIAPEAHGSVDTLSSHHLLGSVPRGDLLPGSAGNLDARLDQPLAHATPPHSRAHGQSSSTVAVPTTRSSPLTRHLAPISFRP
jgi:hypothetical protein